MMNKLVPIVLVIAGLGAGSGAGLLLHPDKAPSDGEAETDDASKEPSIAPPVAESGPKEYIKLSNQFVVPIVEEKRVTSLLVMSLSLELAAGTGDSVFLLEPKLRDAFLQLLFDHANSGGFSGSFTETDRLSVVRRGLLEVAQGVLGPSVLDVLITDILRQDT